MNTPLDYTTKLLMFLLPHKFHSLMHPLFNLSIHLIFGWFSNEVREFRTFLNIWACRCWIKFNIYIQVFFFFSDVEFTHNLRVTHFRNLGESFLSFDKFIRSCKPNQDTEYHYHPRKFGHALPTQFMPLTRGNHCSEIFRSHSTCVCFTTWN